MEVILLKDVEKLGRKGEVVRVKEGYSRNFLLPRGLALVSSDANRKFVEEHKARAAKRHEKALAESRQKAEGMHSVKVVIEAAVGEQGKLYGSVSGEEIAAALKAQGHEVDRKQVQLKEPIRTVGEHEASVEFYGHVKAVIAVEVVAKSS
jgi:large subunit ribosomal protein L9